MFCGHRCRFTESVGRKRVEQLNEHLRVKRIVLNTSAGALVRGGGAAGACSTLRADDRVCSDHIVRAFGDRYELRFVNRGLVELHEFERAQERQRSRELSREQCHVAAVQRQARDERQRLRKVASAERARARKADAEAAAAQARARARHDRERELLSTARRWR